MDRTTGLEDYMQPEVFKVKVLDGYRLRLTFTNGKIGEVDLRDSIVGRGGVKKPLEDLDYFAQVRVDHEAGTIVWPNGVDLDPDVLYEKAMQLPKNSEDLDLRSTKLVRSQAHS